jgi:hypothetical protein
MSINLSIGVMIPTNVVEVGDEISADQLAALGAAYAPSVANAYATNAFVTGQGYITSAPPAQPLLRTLSLGSQPLDETDNYYIYVLDNSETLTLNDDATNNPPIGSAFTILFIASTAGYVSCDSGVTLNGGSGTSFGGGAVKTLIKTAANTWWIG